MLHFSFCPDSGYLFSGSRPPSRVSPAGEVSLSGKETELAEGTGKLFPGNPEATGICIMLTVSLGAVGLCSNPSPWQETNKMYLGFL